MKVRILLIISFISISSIYAQIDLKKYMNLESNLVNSRNNLIDQIALVVPDNLGSKKHSFLNLSGQALVGSTLAAGFAIIPAGLSAAAVFGRETSVSVPVLSIIAVSSYLFGSAVGVHWVAKAENPDLAFWKTFGYSVIGGAGGALILAILSTQYVTVPSAGILVVALCPIISSMLYASLISDWPQDYQKVSSYKNSYSHKDLVEQTKLFNIELLRIKL